MTFKPKLSDQQRNEILYSDRPAKVLAEEFGVSQQYVYNVRATHKQKQQDEELSEWEYHPEDSDDRLKVPLEIIPEGFRYQWIVFEVLGQPQPQAVSRFERQGWRAVPTERHPGLFMPRDHKGAIEVDGLRLYERPISIDDRARAYERRKAHDQMWAKKQQLTGGDIPGVSLAADHPSAIRSNVIRSEYERIQVPQDEE